MTHQTFYRKYRSRTFDEIVGQDHVIQTLKNAIELDRLAHAYIFSGPRGTGKTSTARILAKALNCREGKSVSPCMQCDLCQKITGGQSVDVIEIDAASNTGVDNIRELNDQVNFTPVECLYKFYIIDEAHMLSAGAFNALLKTLEEPPANTIFILATTEPHKIPVTIHSRCQHLLMRRLTLVELCSQLTHIASEESIEIDDGSMQIIARQAGGCMRDAISLLDQLYSFRGNTIAQDDVVMMLGAAHFDAQLELLSCFFKGDSAGVLSRLGHFCDEGVHIAQLVSDLTALVKSMLFVRMELEAQLDWDDARLSQVRDVANLVDQYRLSEVLEAFAKLESDLRWFSNPELLLEVRFLSLLQPTQVAAGAPVQAPSSRASQMAAPAPARPQVSQAPPVSSAPPQPTNMAPSAMPSMPDLSSVSAVPKSAPSSQPPSFGSPPSSTPPSRSSAPSSPAPAAAPQRPAGSASGAQANVKALWKQFLDALKVKNRALYGIVLHSQVVSVTDSRIGVQLTDNFKFLRDKFDEEKSQEVFTEVLSGVFGRTMSLGLSDGSDVNVGASSEGVDEAVAGTGGSGGAGAAVAIGASQKINYIVSLFEGKVVS